ncbi:hypothetical protein CISG_07844 [Coccidioides immitis RMSCC 3703]|uniref:Uncharacterized protein n=1 Tax=Coccidioides immitis RMSCC 3703 TaxID=454286 RepID=A0A0J8R6P3_COCIT|nr:hypothetical protein CISG_07844 [Coccidioides immitis RMSCC 3703]
MSTTVHVSQYCVFHKREGGKYHATDKAKGIDESYKISEKAERGWRGFSSYFEKALDTPTGRKIRDFYLNSDKQVRDIHSEARRLADLKREKSPSAEGPEQKEQPPAVPAGDPAASEAAPATETKIPTSFFPPNFEYVPLDTV